MPTADPFFSRLWCAIQITLMNHRRALIEKIGLGLGFDALSHHRQFHVSGNRQNFLDPVVCQEGAVAQPPCACAPPRRLPDRTRAQIGSVMRPPDI